MLFPPSEVVKQRPAPLWPFLQSWSHAGAPGERLSPQGTEQPPHGPNALPEEPLASAFFREKARRDFSCPGFKALGLDINRAIVCRSPCLSTLAVENASCFQ